jgi:histidyl-tRNA synthetase
VTGVIQELANQLSWEKSMKKPIRLFYINRCYRYEKPQAGRYREFTQFGVECLFGNPAEDKEEVTSILLKCMDQFSIPYKYDDNVKRGLGYYIQEGFEIKCPILGAQKQVAGGGRYKEGIGWAIGVDRLLLAISLNSK